MSRVPLIGVTACRQQLGKYDSHTVGDKYVEAAAFAGLPPPKHLCCPRGRRTLPQDPALGGPRPPRPSLRASAHGPNGDGT